MLGPIEFDTSRDPGTGESYQSRFDHLVEIYEMTLFHFIESHLNPTAKFGHDHDFDVLVFDKNDVPTFLSRLIGDFFNNRVGIYDTATALVNPFFKENRIFFKLAGFLGREKDILFPATYNRSIYCALCQ